MKFNQAAYDMIRPLPLFSAAMRKTNRQGLKTQTRRIVKLPAWSTGEWHHFELGADQSVFYEHADYQAPFIIAQSSGCLAEIRCPHGYPRELRYMREPIFKGEDGLAYYVEYDLDAPGAVWGDPKDPTPEIANQPVIHLLTGEPVRWTWKLNTLSGVYMPKYAARTFKRYQGLRIERLQEISIEDAKAEGVKDSHGMGLTYEYIKLWDSLNAKRGFDWDSNPYVWVISYADDQDITAAQRVERGES